MSIYVQLRYLSARTLSFVLLFSTMLCHQWGCGSSGGNLSDVPGIDAGEPTCGQCPEGEQCHPEARICVPCPNGECALGVDAGDIIPVVDMGPMDESDAADSESVDSTVNEADAETDAESIPIDSEVVDAAMPQPDACAVTGDEACDGIDNDCDGITDESFDVSTDVNHCGGCGQACADRTNADVACLDGACIFTCREGWLDNDNDPETGCEESAASISFSSPDDAAALRDNFTIRLEIVGAQQIALIELKANDQLLVRRAPMPIVEYEAIIADMPEGNVTLTAEYFDLDLESLGSVERTIIVDGTNPTLQFVNPMNGAELNQLDITANIRVNNEAGPVTVTLSQVTDNAVEFIADNQQNGSLPFSFAIEEGVLQPGSVTLRAVATDQAGNEGTAETTFSLKLCAQDEMVTVADFPSAPFRIDRYEASLYDATRTGRGTLPQAGGDSPLICSRADVIPWYGVNFSEAFFACEAVGKRLCTPAEFEWACGTAALNDYPYGRQYRPNHCNGDDFEDFDGLDPNNPNVTPAGFMMSCVARVDRLRADSLVYDLSGNLAEWTTTNRFGVGLAGGHYADAQDQLQCNWRLDINPEASGDLYGFRCCQDGID